LAHSSPSHPTSTPTSRALSLATRRRASMPTPFSDHYNQARSKEVGLDRYDVQKAFTDIGATLGMQWKKLTPSEREPFLKLAYMVAHPGHGLGPRCAGVGGASGALVPCLGGSPVASTNYVRIPHPRPSENSRSTGCGPARPAGLLVACKAPRPTRSSLHDPPPPAARSSAALRSPPQSVPGRPV
jgi:hypothetical protein